MTEKNNKKESKKTVTKNPAIKKTQKKVSAQKEIVIQEEKKIDTSNIEALAKQKEMEAPKSSKKMNGRLIACLIAAVVILAIVFSFAKMSGGISYKLNEIYAPLENETLKIKIPSEVYFTNDGMLYKKVKGNQIDVYAQLYIEPITQEDFDQVITMYESVEEAETIEIGNYTGLIIRSTPEEGVDYRVYLLHIGDYGFTGYFLGTNETEYFNILKSIK